MPNLGIGGVLADSRGDAWIATVNGLVHVSLNPLSVRTVGSDNGLASAEFDSTVPVILPSDVIVAPTMSSLVAIDTRAISAPVAAPDASFASVALRRGDSTIELPPASGRITLEPHDRDLRITGRIHSLSSPNARRYRFRLRGYDRDWVEDREGERVFTRLEHGSYVLEMVAANADGPWSVPRRIEITVLPAWWQTTLARVAFLALFLAIAGGLALAYRARLRRMHAANLLEQRRRLAEQASAAKSRFLADLAHEIRTPMTGVLGMAVLLHSDTVETRQRGRIEAIQAAGQHLLQLMNDALDLARIESGRLELQDVAFDLPGVLESACALLRPQAEAKGLGFELELDPTVPRGIQGDPVRLRQILLNLGHNAIKFTAAGGVAVRVHWVENRLCVEVADSGKGMSDEQQARLFQRFEQAEGLLTQQQHGGAGLGLSICRELARALGGDITVESSLGSGARFRVWLPWPVATLPETPRKPLRVGEESRGQVRILLVDDDPLIAEVVSELLERQGHVVQRAAHGLEAITLATDGAFDLVLLDLDLPGIDGMQLARIWRDQGIDMPVVAVTARVDPEAEGLVRAAGMRELVRKPVTGEEMAALVRRHAAIAPAATGAGRQEALPTS